MPSAHSVFIASICVLIAAAAYIPGLVTGFTMPHGKSGDFRLMHGLTQKKEIKYMLFRWFGDLYEECQFGEVSFTDCTVHHPSVQVVVDIVDSDRPSTVLIFQEERAFLLLEGTIDVPLKTGKPPSFLVTINNPNRTFVSTPYLKERARKWVWDEYGIALDYSS
jgi:hypothetical protein